MSRRRLRIGLRQRGLIIALIDVGDQIVGGEMLVVRNRNRRELGGRFRRNGVRPRFDEGVVGPLVTTRVVPIEIGAGRRYGECVRGEGYDEKRDAD